MTKHNKKNFKINSSRSLGVNSRGNNRTNNNFNRGNISNYITRRNDCNDFSRIFEDLVMPGMDGSGLPGLDKFFGNFNSISRGFRDFENGMLSNFQSVGNNSMPGTFICKSYVSKVNYAENGQQQRETYQTQSIKQIDKDGTKIQEKQQAYQNTKTGIKKAAHERMLNEKAHKIVKKINKTTGEDYEHNFYQGMNGSDLESFNKEYSRHRNKINLGNHHFETYESSRALPELKSNLFKLGSNSNNNNVCNSNGLSFLNNDQTKAHASSAYNSKL